MVKSAKLSPSSFVYVVDICVVEKNLRLYIIHFSLFSKLFYALSRVRFQDQGRVHVMEP
jgi:hypothetical protein